ncbi:RNA-directed DNA polymerase from mobile element jockey [Plakobranchus ocellatus]|uniref:RNA-directed DNA polymerase from mobile element jockey n=1 Tax=Plakobranchus ocellatus TaxID=259542 RepID=A0AAV4AB92_9GAST|nr:RNA-directed DNA polymerase from mobile element jockey [Plakobranchus ocellatus]
MNPKKNPSDHSPQPDVAKKPCTEAARGAASVASKGKAEDLPTLMSVSPFAGWSPFKKFMVISSKGSAKVADRSPFKIHRELKSIQGDKTIEVTKLGSGDLMVELKSNDQAKKLGAIATFLDIPVTVIPHKSLNSSKGVIRSRDLRCCSEEEMVEELSGVTHARRIKVRQDRTSRSRCAAISANAMATARTGVRNLLLYALDVARVVMSNVTVWLTPIASTAKETIQPAARPVQSSWKNKPFFASKLRMAVHFSKPVRQLLLNSIKRFQPELLLVPSNLSFERSQQRSPRMAAEVPLLPCPRGKKPRRILRLPVPREQQKPKYQSSAGPKSPTDRRPLGKPSIVLCL